MLSLSARGSRLIHADEMFFETIGDVCVSVTEEATNFSEIPNAQEAQKCFLYKLRSGHILDSPWEQAEKN